MQNPIQVKKINLDLEQLKRDSRRINNKVCKAWGDAEVATDRTYQATLADQLRLRLSLVDCMTTIMCLHFPMMALTNYTERYVVSSKK
jgi:hypothetical protein